jgi:hypothetical protein
MTRPPSVLLLIILCNTGCHVWHTEDVTPQLVLGSRSQARIRVTRTDGSRLILNRAAVHGDTLSGFVWRKGAVEIPLNQVRETATPRMSTGRTVGLLLGIGALVVGTYLVVLAIGLSHNQ